MQNFNHERFAFCAMSTRFARVCLEDSLKFAGKRKTFGKTLIQHPVIRWKVAEMARMIEATHNWLEWITFQLNTMPKMEAMLKLGGHTALCKVQCTKAHDPRMPRLDMILIACVSCVPGPCRSWSTVLERPPRSSEACPIRAEVRERRWSD